MPDRQDIGVYRLRLLGGLGLERVDGGVVAPLPKRRAEAVLAALAMCGDLGCTRDRLLAMLWPESDEAHSRHGLRDALHVIRRALGRAAVSGSNALVLNPTIVDSDVRALRLALEHGRLEDAVRLYTRPLLDGFHIDGAPEFERWVDAERVRMAREHGESLDQLARRGSTEGKLVEAAGWWARAVEHDPLNSHLALRHAEALANMGDRANAVKGADAHAARLRRELDLEPGAEFAAGVERIRSGRRPETTTRRPIAIADPAAPLSPAPNADPVGSGPVASTADTRAAHASTAIAAAPGEIRSGRRPGWWRWVAVAVAATVTGAVGNVAGVWHWPGASAEPSHPPRSAIAVLPFRSLGGDSSTAYLAAGLHDELVLQLTRVGSLTVVGLTSVGAYQGTSKSLRQIGNELDVGSVVDASVQVDHQRLRVIVRLLDPVRQAEVWNDRFERPLDDAYAVESDIAQRIVAGVGVALSEKEADAIAVAPTANTHAYQLYLQALQYERRPGVMRENLAAARGLYEHAIALDSAFAPAHARLAIVLETMWHHGYDRTALRLEQARRESRIALRLGPELPQAHVAAGLSEYLSHDDYRGALAEFELALGYAPGDAELWMWKGRAQRGLGNWDGALVAFARARRLDPRDENLMTSIGNTLHALRRYPAAIDVYRQALELGPDVMETRLSIAWSYVLWKGQLDTLQAVLDAMPPDGDPGAGAGPIRYQRLMLLFMQRRPDSVLAMLRELSRANGVNPASYSHWSAQAQLMRRDTVAARAAFDTAARYLDSLSRMHPDNEGFHSELGEALSALGRADEARRELRWLERHGVANLSIPLMLVRLGQTDASLAAVEQLLAKPTTVSVPYLRLDPHWDAIVREPGAAALFRKYAVPSL
jgi:TolB-like protein/DNA-binding SARP family transcriptional activator